uniref:Uncharacterized protein n=1 Tax=Knipowitschia caucasica TaxID=637954 RepID=A0AAV2JWJ3_KNICA
MPVNITNVLMAAPRRSCALTSHSPVLQSGGLLLLQSRGRTDNTTQNPQRGEESLMPVGVGVEARDRPGS